MVHVLVQPRSVLHRGRARACVPRDRCQRKCPQHNNLSALRACLSCMGCWAQQEFFYHVLLVLDSYTFNSHLKAELVAKIARLYQQLNTLKGRRKGVGNVGERGAASDTSNAAVNKGARGFTGTMVKLKVRLTCMRCERLCQLRHEETLFGDTLSHEHPRASAFDMTFVLSRFTDWFAPGMYAAYSMFTNPQRILPQPLPDCWSAWISKCCNLFDQLSRFNHIQSYSWVFLFTGAREVSRALDLLSQLGHFSLRLGVK